MNSKFSANRGSYLQCFSLLKHWAKRFCADFSRSVANRMQVITNIVIQIHHNTLINGMRPFFPENWTDFPFQELPEEIQSKIVYIYSVINEYSLRSRDVHSTPSWHKWSDFEYRPWCLAIVVRTPPEWHASNSRIASMTGLVRARERRSRVTRGPFSSLNVSLDGLAERANRHLG